MHILHISTEGSVEWIRQAQKYGMRVIAEACPHHFTLTDTCLCNRDSNYKMSPPLRTNEYMRTILTGLCDGTLDRIATDHAPHMEEKTSAISRKHPMVSSA